MNGGNHMFQNLRKLKVNLKEPENGILLVVKGDFNDADDISQYWMFSHDDLELVIWLMKHYNQNVHHWDDSCMELYAHTISECHAYAFENGKCMEIDVSACEMPDTSSLYDSYYEGWDDEEDEE